MLSEEYTIYKMLPINPRLSKFITKDIQCMTLLVSRLKNKERIIDRRDIKLIDQKLYCTDIENKIEENVNMLNSLYAGTIASLENYKFRYE